MAKELASLPKCPCILAGKIADTSSGFETCLIGEATGPDCDPLYVPVKS